MSSTPDVEGFERQLERIEQIVERLGSDVLELDEALALFEEGVRLLRSSQGTLESTGMRIRQLLEDADGTRVEPWEP